MVGAAMATLTVLTPGTSYPQLGVTLFVVGVGLGLAFTVASDVILASFAGLVDSADEVVTRVGFDGNDWWQGFVFDGDLFPDQTVWSDFGAGYIFIPLVLPFVGGI